MPPDAVETQLVLQRRILEVLADREAEIRELRIGRARATRTEDAGQTNGTGPDGARAALRERWLRGRERQFELEERVASLEAALGGGSDAVTSPPDPDRPFAACTIVCRNYLAHARTLMSSLARHEPSVRRYLLVLDGRSGDLEVDGGITVVAPDRLRIQAFEAMSFKYGVVEFNTAVKPYLLSLLFDEFGETEVVYFDPDIVVERRLDELRAELGATSIVLTPHLTEPIPDDGLTPSEREIMISGAYNLGFIGLRSTPETHRFLEWWKTRLEDGCRIDVAKGLFTDQKWIDLVPSLFPDSRILRDPTYNVAFWNLHERRVDGGRGAYRVNGRPAAFFHISGFDPTRLDRVSKHQTRTSVEPGSALAELLADYASRLFDAGWQTAREEEYGYLRFDDGVPVPDLLRTLYLGLTSGERARFGDPFRNLGPGGFRDWATRPRDESGGLSYFMLEIYAARIDLREAFPDVRGRDRDGFREWARTQGPIEMGYDPVLVRSSPDPEPGADMGGPRSEPAGASLERGGADPRYYDGLVDRIRGAVEATTPAGSTILVVSRGDYRLGHLEARHAWHFPRAANGLYAGYHPQTSADAIEHLETLRAAGAEYLLFPATASWWLDYYDDFRAHLDERHDRILDDADVCRIYALRGDA